jgi:hypothetical protein
MKKTFQPLLVIAFICCTISVHAKKASLTFETLTGMADMIITGHISNVLRTGLAI